MKRGFSENKLDKNNQRTYKVKNISKDKINNNIKKNNESKNKEVPKSIFNIDLFTGIKEQFEKEKNNKSNNIYLNFYNKHTKNQVLQKENKISKKFFDNNVEMIKEKQEKHRIKKEEEEKIKKQKEREDSNEYRKEQMAKLYKMEKVYKREILKRKNRQILPKKKIEKITITAINKNDTKIIDKSLENSKNNGNGKNIKMTRKEYDKKLDFFNRQIRLYMNELEKLPIANKTTKVYQKEAQLNKNIKELQDTISKFQNKIGITVVDD